MNAPELAGTEGCDAAGNCDVQDVLIHNRVPSNVYFLPFRGYNDIAMKENTAVSSYNALEVSFRHPFRARAHLPGVLYLVPCYRRCIEYQFPFLRGR